MHWRKRDSLDIAIRFSLAAIGWVLLVAIIVWSLVQLAGCACQVSYQGRRFYEAEVCTQTGVYRLVATSCVAVQREWEKIAPSDVCHLQVTSFVNRKTMEIWYCSQAGLEAELHNVASYKNLRGARERDLSAAFLFFIPLKGHW